MDHQIHNSIVSFIWSIADDVLRDVYVRGKYRDVILPMTVIRRLDCILEPLHDRMREVYEGLQQTYAGNDSVITAQMKHRFGLPFWNTSKFTLKTLLNEPTHLRRNFEHYLKSFSPNVQDIVYKFKFLSQLDTLEEAGAIGKLLEKLVDPRINLSPLERQGPRGETQPALTNLGMGYVFEELIRRFNEENNEEAGEHFTPRDIIKLMAHLAFRPVRQKVQGKVLLYDDACGSGGMLTEAEQFLSELLEAEGTQPDIDLYGQEVNPETYAICAADLLIKGKNPEHIFFGSTLSRDHFASQKFEFMFANPPYGKSWQLDKEAIVDGKTTVNGKSIDNIVDLRFKGVGVPRVSDGQLLFLMNKVRKMQDETELGSRIVHVHNGSALFTGDAGQGESEIRRYILEHDLLEAIIALPENMFYNTGIATYLWVLSNRKTDGRKGKVQLIDASKIYKPLRKNLGKKNCEFTEAQNEQIMGIYMGLLENEQSKVFNNTDFGYYQITVERPLRLNFQVSSERLSRLEGKKPLKKMLAASRAELNRALKTLGDALFKNAETFGHALLLALSAEHLTPKKPELEALLEGLSERDESAEPVVKECKGSVVTYEPDPELRDFENVPLKEDVQVYLEREVLPHVPDAWIDHTATKVGYEISFTRYFYQYTPLRPLEDIAAEILALERETEGVLREIVEV